MRCLCAIVGRHVTCGCARFVTVLTSPDLSQKGLTPSNLVQNTSAWPSAVRYSDRSFI